MNPNYDQLLAFALHLDAMQYRTFLRLIGSLPADLKAPLPTLTAVQVLAYDWMTALNMWTETQRVDLLKAVEPTLQTWATRFEVREGTHAWPFFLTFYDFQFVSWVDAHPASAGATPPDFYDTRSGQRLEQLPAQAATVVLLDLNVLMFRLLGKMERQENTHAQLTSPAGPGAEQPAAAARSADQP